MGSVKLFLAAGMWSAVQQHLRPKRAKFEEAAFVFATVEEAPGSVDLHAVEWYAVPPEGFDEQSPYFLQLSDETKGRVIKRAHDLQSALIEVHSHPFQDQAEFSPSDISGFAEFVPQVRWRLKGRPYAAIVVANQTFDAFAWTGQAVEAGPLHSLVADGELLRPTRATETKRPPYGPGRPVQPK